MRRMDLYSTMHKGLRAAMFDAAQAIARTEFGEAGPTGHAVAAARRLLAFLDAHAAAEDRVLMPELERLGPTVFADLQADHSRIGGLQMDITRDLDRLAAAAGEERIALGQRLHEKMNRLISEHLLHMHREETTANRLLWAHRTDEELTVLQRRIIGPIPADQLVEWAEILIPAINPQERAGFLAGLRAKVSPAEFTRLAALAGASVPQLDGSAVSTRVEG